MRQTEKIEFLRISQDTNGAKSIRQILDRQELSDRILNGTLDGTSVLLNINGLPEANAILIFTRNDFTEILSKGKKFKPKVSDMSQILVFPLDISDSPDPKANSHTPSPSRNGRNQNTNTDTHTSGEEMTEPQRRFIFRLLAEKRELKGKEAEKFLKEEFDVTSLNEIAKVDASELINQLLSEEDSS
jgi:hypothetical protein